MYQVLSKQERLQVASECGTEEIRVSQFIRQCIPSCRRSHGKGTTAIRVQLEPWGDEQVAAGWTEMLSFSDLSDRHAQLRQVVGRLAVKTLVCHPAELTRDPICHIEPVQLSVKELCQTSVVLPCAAHDSRSSVHDSLQLVDDSLGWSGQQDVALVQSRRYKSMDKRRCRLSVEWTTYSSKLT